jgi:hypothetical protein
MSILVEANQGGNDSWGESVLNTFDVAASRAGLRMYHAFALQKVSANASQNPTVLDGGVGFEKSTGITKILWLSARILQSVGVNSADKAQALAVKAVAAAMSGTILAVVSESDCTLFRILKGRQPGEHVKSLLTLLDEEVRTFSPGGGAFDNC